MSAAENTVSGIRAKINSLVNIPERNELDKDEVLALNNLSLILLVGMVVVILYLMNFSNFSRVAKVVHEHATAVITKNSIPRYLAIGFSRACIMNFI